MDVNSGSWLFREEPLEVIKNIFRRALGAETVREARLLDGGLFQYHLPCDLRRGRGAGGAAAGAGGAPPYHGL